MRNKITSVYATCIPSFGAGGKYNIVEKFINLLKRGI